MDGLYKMTNSKHAAHALEMAATEMLNAAQLASQEQREQLEQWAEIIDGWVVEYQERGE